MVDLVGSRIRCGPEVGEVCATDGEADAVAGFEAPGGAVQVDVEFVDVSGFERFGVGERFSAGGVEDAVADEGAGSVRGHVGEAGNEGHDWSGRVDVEDDFRLAQDFEGNVEGFGGIGEAVNFIWALVCGQAEGDAAGPEAAAKAHCRAVGVGVDFAFGMGGMGVEGRVWGEVEGASAAVGNREGGFGTPVPGGVQAVCVRFVVLLHVDAHGRFVHDAIVFAFEPVIAPADDFGQMVDAGAWYGGVRTAVVPGAYEDAFGYRKILEST